MGRIIGGLCLAVCVVCITWVGFNFYFDIRPSGKTYRFDNVRAAEGTVMVVKNGSLDLANTTGSLSVEKPFVRHTNNMIWALCFLGCLAGGVALRRSRGQ